MSDLGSAARALWAEQGAGGFTRGWGLRALQFSPAAMLFFSAFESFRDALSGLAGSA